ncbi:unnamed protein product [Clonostachys rosea]|uniref:G-protein coupled receptors family 1 profile domain-containing protein n=1 Tax=Bionectria ochroleuca TaxID=29856 RepID=A0ABY6UIG1_BIOOC|nr:unnamed protein product [Clonostachys rosea]
MPVYGAFVPQDYVPDLPSTEELSDASVVWGMSLSLTLFAFIRCFSQTYAQWRRIRKVNLYMTLIWLELLSSTIIGVIYFAYMRGHIPPRFVQCSPNGWIRGILLWAIQVQCLYQIILNRAGLIADNTALVRRLKWAVFSFIVLINIAVACIWIPAQLQISQRYIRINEIWDRTEKVILAILDVCLNLYFIYLVRSTLIARGLSRYVTLYRVNIFMISISMTMDVLIITMMSLNNSYLYVSIDHTPFQTLLTNTNISSYVFFHPLAYLIKLHIELSMADLIAKLVKIGSIAGRCDCECHQDLGPNAVGFAPTIGRLSNWTPIQQYRARHRNDCTRSEGSTETEPTTPPENTDMIEDRLKQTVGGTWASSDSRNSMSTLERAKSAKLDEECQKISSAALPDDPHPRIPAAVQ